MGLLNFLFGARRQDTASLVNTALTERGQHIEAIDETKPDGSRTTYTLSSPTNTGRNRDSNSNGGQQKKQQQNYQGNGGGQPQRGQRPNIPGRPNN